MTLKKPATFPHPEPDNSSQCPSKLLKTDFSNIFSYSVLTKVKVLFFVGRRWDCKSTTKPHQLAHTQTLALVCRLKPSFQNIQRTMQMARPSKWKRLNFLTNIQLKQHQYTGTKCLHIAVTKTSTAMSNNYKV